MSKKLQFDRENLAKLKDELLLLRKYLNFKNSGFCKRFLDGIIKRYFKKRSEFESGKN